VERANTKAGLLGYLSVAAHLLFWVSLYYWEAAAGEAGSPLPDNWQELLVQTQVAATAAVVCLAASVGCGLEVLSRRVRPPVSSVVSLVLFFPCLYFWWTTLMSKDF
jgi:hypothetical protein